MIQFPPKLYHLCPVTLKWHQKGLGNINKQMEGCEVGRSIIRKPRWLQWFLK